MILFLPLFLTILHLSVVLYLFHLLTKSVLSNRKKDSCLYFTIISLLFVIMSLFMILVLPSEILQVAELVNGILYLAALFKILIMWFYSKTFKTTSWYYVSMAILCSILLYAGSFYYEAFSKSYVVNNVETHITGFFQ